MNWTQERLLEIFMKGINRMNSLKKYITTYKLTWKQATDYRFEFLMELVCTFIPVIALSFLWKEIYTSKDMIEGFSVGEMLSYILIARFVTLIITPEFLFDVMGEIQSGEIQNYICKPISYIKYWFVKSVGSKTRNMIWCTLSIFLLFLFFSGTFEFSISFVEVIIFLFVSLLSLLLYFEIIMLVSILSFWFYEISSWYYTITFAIEFMAGGLFPLDLFPKNVQTICNILPFKYLIYYPANILVNGYQKDELVWAVSVPLIWIILFSILLKIVWRKGIKHYELIGG